MKLIELVNFFVVAVIILTSSNVLAETIYMKDGRVLNEKIIERTERYILTKDEVIVRKYYLDEVDYIAEDIKEDAQAPDTAAMIDFRQFEDISDLDVLQLLLQPAQHREAGA